jgi:glycosyltransferase involved in cell wall biosynthesis
VYRSRVSPELDSLCVDVGLPVFNEEAALRRSVELLHGYLESSATFRWRIVVIDNGSTDRTAALAMELGRELDGVELLQLGSRGKGRALRRLIETSEADIVSYMDIDLSTNLVYHGLLIEGIRCGYDICFGTRLMQGSLTRRSLRREIVSRVFNRLVQLAFGAKFSDASCGFKAFRRDTVKALLPLIGSDSWCFDVELLLVAERNGMRLFEIPVEWIEGGQSKVELPKVTAEYLRELLRIRATLASKRL